MATINNKEEFFHFIYFYDPRLKEENDYNIKNLTKISKDDYEVFSKYSSKLKFPLRRNVKFIKIPRFMLEINHYHKEILPVLPILAKDNDQTFIAEHFIEKEYYYNTNNIINNNSFDPYGSPQGLYFSKEQIKLLISNNLIDYAEFAKRRDNFSTDVLRNSDINNSTWHYSFRTIAAYKSSKPFTSSINYNIPPTVDDLLEYGKIKSNVSPEELRDTYSIRMNVSYNFFKECNDKYKLCFTQYKNVSSNLQALYSYLAKYQTYLVSGDFNNVESLRLKVVNDSPIYFRKQQQEFISNLFNTPESITSFNDWAIANTPTFLSRRINKIYEKQKAKNK